MAEVHIVDIDGEQWDIKDQPLTTRVTTLETKTTVNVIKKVDSQDVKINLVEINNEKFLQLHFNGLSWSGTISETVVSFVQDFGMSSVVRCMVGLDFEDRVGRLSASLDIQPDGQIKIYPHTPDRMVGFYRACRIYGDSFIRVEL